MGCTAVKPEEENVIGHFEKSLMQHQNEQDEYTYLSNITHFDEATLRLLHVRFNAIDGCIERDSRISFEEFAKIIEISPDSILLRRFFKFIEKEQNLGGLTFRTFASTMSVLSQHASEDEKIKLSFYLCDLNDDGFIDKNELFNLIKDCLMALKPPNIFKHYCKNESIDIILQNTLKQMNILQTEKENIQISFEQYHQFITHKNNLQYKQRILAAFSLDINKLIQYEAESRRLIMISNKEIIDKKKILHHGPLYNNDRNSSIGKIKDYIMERSLNDKIERVDSISDPLKITCD